MNERVNDASAPPARRRPARGWRLAVIALIGAELVYLAIANLTFALGGVQAAFASTDSVKVDFASAWSPWPGRVFVRDVVMRMQDRNVQFVLRVARANVTVSLRDLLRRTFHATRVRGDGVSFRVRHRIAPETAGDPRMVALPSLEGFADPPLIASGPPDAPLTEANYHLWTIHLEDVDVELQELWTQLVRYQGPARARGAFWLRPAKRLWVGPAILDLQGGTLSTGPHTVMTDVRGELDCTVHPFDVEPVHGMDVARFISAELAFSGHLPDLSALAFWTSGDLGGWSLQGGAGALKLRFALENGRLAPDGEAHYETDHLRVAYGPAGYALGAGVTARLRAPGPDRTAHAEVALERAAVAVIDATGEPTPIEVQGFEARATTSSVDVAEPWSIESAALALSALRVPDLVRAGPLLPNGNVRIAGGAAQASFRADRDHHGAWRGAASVEIAGAALDLGDAQAAVDAKLTATLASTQAGAHHATFAVELPSIVAQTDDLRVTSGGTLKATYASASDVPVKWTGDLALRKTEAHRSGRENTTAPGECPSFEAASAQLTGTLEWPERSAPTGQVDGHFSKVRLAWGDFAALVSDVRVGGRAEAGGNVARVLAGRLGLRHVTLKSAGGAPRSWQATIAQASAEGHLDSAGVELHGPLRLSLSGLTGQVGHTTLAGNVEGVLQLAARRPAAAWRVSGDVRARKVNVTSGSRAVNDWWANLRVSDAEVRAGRDVDLRAAVQASLQNALPLLHSLTSSDEIPAWMATALPLENLSAVLDVERYCRLTDVRLREIKGGPLLAQGRFQLEPGDTRGAVVVTLPALIPISMGFHFAGGRSDTSTVVGASWLAGHTELMNATLAAKRAGTCQAAPQCR